MPRLAGDMSYQLLCSVWRDAGDTASIIRAKQRAIRAGNDAFRTAQVFPYKTEVRYSQYEVFCQVHDDNASLIVTDYVLADAFPPPPSSSMIL
jgi:hypothetical protein